MLACMCRFQLSRPILFAAVSAGFCSTFHIQIFNLGFVDPDINRNLWSYKYEADIDYTLPCKLPFGEN